MGIIERCVYKGGYIVETPLCPTHTPSMDREARHGAEAHWLSNLCSQLKGCQTTSDVADVVGVLDTAPLFSCRTEDVFDQLRNAMQFKDLPEVMLAGTQTLSFRQL